MTSFGSLVDPDGIYQALAAPIKAYYLLADSANAAVIPLLTADTRQPITAMTIHWWRDEEYGEDIVWIGEPLAF